MKILLPLALLALLVPIVSTTASNPATTNQGFGPSHQAIRPRQSLKGYRVVDTKTLQDLIASGSVTVLDSRTAKYDDGRRIPGAKSLPYNATQAQINAMLPDKEATLVTYCAGPKCPMGSYLAEALVRLGYTHVMKYTEGLEGWQQAGNQIDHVK